MASNIAKEKTHWTLRITTADGRHNVMLRVYKTSQMSSLLHRNTITIVSLNSKISKIDNFYFKNPSPRK